MIRSTTRLSALAATAALGVLAGTAATAPAVVPPRDCGTMSVSGKRYQIKVDQISCRDGKGYAKRYLQSKSSPRGYTCRRFTPQRNRVAFMCNNGRRQFLAIRR